MNERKEENEFENEQINSNQEHLEKTEFEEKVISETSETVNEQENVKEVIVDTITVNHSETIERIEMVSETSNHAEPLEKQETPYNNDTFNSFMANQQLNQKNNMGLTGFILSIAAILLSWIPILNWILWLLGLIFSIIGMNKKPKGFAIAGLVISLIGIVVMIFLVALIAAVFAVS